MKYIRRGNSGIEKAWTYREDVTSTIFSRETGLLTALIETKKEIEVSTTEIRHVFVQAEIDTTPG